MFEKVIVDFSNYKINNVGEIFNIKTNKKLKQYCKNNYYNVYLYKNGKRYFKLVHRLVAESFIPNKDNYPQINHKDENGLNNRVDNLEWCSAKYNCNYGTHKLKISKRMSGQNHPFYGKHHSEKALEKMKLAKLGKESKRKREIMIDGIKYNSVTEAMKTLNIGTRRLYKILGGN